MASVPPSRSTAAVDDLDSDRSRRRSGSLPLLTLWVGGVLGLVALVWGAFVLIGSLSESNPELTPALIAGTLAGLIVLAIFGMRAANAPPPLPKKRADPEDGSGGGGSRRPEPKPRPRTPTPSGPDPEPNAPWEDFDAVRSGWERVPAGHV